MLAVRSEIGPYRRPITAFSRVGKNNHTPKSDLSLVPETQGTPSSVPGKLVDFLGLSVGPVPSA